MMSGRTFACCRILDKSVGDLRDGVPKVTRLRTNRRTAAPEAFTSTSHSTAPCTEQWEYVPTRCASISLPMGGALW